MFQFGRFPSYNYEFMARSMILHHGGFPIRKSTGRSLFAAHRSLSQLVTSFFGSWCQGIPFMLLLAWTSVYCLSNISVLSLELLCITFFSCLIFSLWQNWIFLPFLERPDFKLICYLCLFPFLLYLSLFVYLNSSFLFGFQWTFACFRLRLSFSRLSRLHKYLIILSTYEAR